jgi:hypothetical protein
MTFNGEVYTFLKELYRIEVKAQLVTRQVILDRYWHVEEETKEIKGFPTS